MKEPANLREFTLIIFFYSRTVLILKKGAGAWQSAKTATGKSVDVTVTPTAAGEAEQVQVRVQLRKNNQNYGQPSSIEYVSVNP